MNIDELIYQLGGKSAEDAFHTLLEHGSEHLYELAASFYDAPNEQVASMLLEIIGAQRNPETIPFLAEQLDDSRAEVWKTSLDALVMIGGKQSLDALDKAKQRLEPDRLEWLDEAILQITTNLEGTSL